MVQGHFPSNHGGLSSLYVSDAHVIQNYQGHPPLNHFAVVSVLSTALYCGRGSYGGIHTADQAHVWGREAEELEDRS